MNSGAKVARIEKRVKSQKFVFILKMSGIYVSIGHFGYIIRNK